MSKSLKVVSEFFITVVYKLLGSVPLAGLVSSLIRHSGKLYWLATLILRVYVTIASVLNGIHSVIKSHGKMALCVIVVCVILFMLAKLVL